MGSLSLPAGRGGPPCGAAAGGAGDRQECRRRLHRPRHRMPGPRAKPGRKEATPAGERLRPTLRAAGVPVSPAGREDDRNHRAHPFVTSANRSPSAGAPAARGAFMVPSTISGRPGGLGAPPGAGAKYRLCARLGRGGQAEVFLALASGPRGFRKLVALKRLHAAAAEQPELVAMLLDEARLAARLNHPNVVHTYEVDADGDACFIAMEFLEGQSLGRARARDGARAFGPATWAKVAADALAGLHYAHELCDFDGQRLNVVHRDVSPHNIFVTYEGVGQARRLRHRQDGAQPRAHRGRHHQGQDRLHGARAGARAGRPAGRRLFDGRRALGNARRPPALRGRALQGAAPRAPRPNPSEGRVGGGVAVWIRFFRHSAPFPSGTEGAQGSMPWPTPASRADARWRPAERSTRMPGQPWSLT